MTFKLKWIYIYTCVTFIISVAVNYYYPFLGLWMLFLLPIFGVITLFPKWYVGNLCALIMPMIRISTQYAAFSGNIPADYLIRLISTSIVAWIILLTVTFFSVKLNRVIQQLESLSFTDNLTQAYNRRYLELYSEKLLFHSLAYNQPLCLFIFDIDHFKKINDTYGHNAGDMVLLKLTQLVQRLVRPEDPLIRLGGEEFALFFPNTPLEEGLRSTERIRKTIEAHPFESNGVSIPITISAGVTMYSGGTLEQFMEQADRALYQAKSTGRNKVETQLSS
jgi:diguanylate cyclase (GGDEF) domain